VFDYKGLVQFGIITGTKPVMQLLDSNSALIWYAVNNTVNAQLVYLSKGSFIFNKAIQYSLTVNGTVCELQFYNGSLVMTVGNSLVVAASCSNG
jgi:hypothetical protein